MKMLFGNIDLSFKKIIIMAVIAGIYTGVIAMMPIANDTSFKDISVYFEVWILFGIFIIMNSKSNKDSALKCFIFFLISQPIVYLIQVPFSEYGWQLFSYYRYWFIWTLLTIPMGYIGYYMKKDKWWGLLILVPILVFLGYHYSNYLGEVIFDFPHHLLSLLFVLISTIFYPIIIFNNKKIKIVGVIFSFLLILIASIYTLKNPVTYNTTLLVNGEKDNFVFDDSFKVYLGNSRFGKVYIKYYNGLDDYIVNAEFVRTGKTDLILEDKDGNKTVFDLNVKRSKYDLNKK